MLPIEFGEAATQSNQGIGNEKTGAHLLGMSIRGSVMQDWILVLAPLSIVSYFLVHPDRLVAFIHWFGRLIQ